MNTEVTAGKKDELVEFNPTELSEIITSRVQKMNELEEKMSTVKEEAKNAIEAANNANKKIGWGAKKKAIEELQSAGTKIAYAVQVSGEAHQLSFEYQKELTKISKFLFSLGVSNIVQNRIIVRELELKMSGASKEKISELAKQELLSVIRQLKTQEDIQSKQEKISTKLKEHNSELARQAEADKRHDEELARQAEISELQGQQIADLIIQFEQLKKISLISLIGFGVGLIALGISLSHFFM